MHDLLRLCTSRRGFFHTCKLVSYRNLFFKVQAQQGTGETRFHPQSLNLSTHPRKAWVGNLVSLLNGIKPLNANKVVMYTLMAPSAAAYNFRGRFWWKNNVLSWLQALWARCTAEPLCLCSCQSLASSKALARGYWGITLSMNLWALHYSTVIACFWLLQHFLHARILPSELSFAHLLGAGKEQLLGYSKSCSSNALFPCSDLLNPSLFCEKVTAPTGSVIADNSSWCSSQSLWKPSQKKPSPLAINYPMHLQCEPRGWKHLERFFWGIFFCCKMLHLSLQQFTLEALRSPKCSLTAQAKCSAGNWQCDSEPTSSAKSWLRGEKCEKICR